jgi:hypothetical protein
MAQELTQERLKELLHYDPENGVFTWVRYRKNGAYPGDVAGGLSHRGYWRIKLDGVFYQAHKLAWLYVYGVMPVMMDHKNRRKDDNRIRNIRPATKSENGQNLPVQGRSASGITGVTRHHTQPKWLARITYRGKLIYLGTFDILEDAAQAYAIAKANLHTFNPTTT